MDNQLKRINKTTKIIIPFNILSLFKFFLDNKIIAIPIENIPFRVQGFSVLNFTKHIIIEFNNKLNNTT